MANKINFITGETYTLAELFSGERRIIIPDLQRDYCWGDENNTKSTDEKGELVTDFVNNLLEQFDEQLTKNDKSAFNLGLFYGYEVPSDHIQLCDGQQRLTTLYLLLGMINKKTGKFRQHLISDFEFKHDDKEPYLNYAIRESSLYFLSDLVCKFFIDNNDSVGENNIVDKIKSADWYFDDYNLDPSIQNILKALAKIKDILAKIENKFADKGTDYLSDFGDWLLNKVTFLYFDMENRKNGEETFVVINTTGESLSSTQNLKPLVLQEKNGKFDNTSFEISDGTENRSIDKCWEEIETWFWKKRKGENDTADAGFAEFLRWISIIEQIDKPAPVEEKNKDIRQLIQLILQGKKCEFPYKEIPFAKIYNYWKALRWIAEDSKLSFVDNFLSPAINKDVSNRNAISQNDCFVLLPVLKYSFQSDSIISRDNGKQRNAKRIYEFFKNLIRVDSVSKSVNALVADAIKIIDLLAQSNDDLVSLLDTSAISKQILTYEEKIKLEILKKSANRNDVEEAFWSAQEHPIWGGEILPMIEWATDGSNFNLDKFNNYKAKFTEIFAGECDSNFDNVRRALLTRGLKDYPRKFEGNTNYSFGWKNNSYFHELIKDNRSHFKDFFDDLLNGSDISTMINHYCNIDNVFYRFVKHPELLSYCEQKNIQKWNNSFCLVNQRRATKCLEFETFCLYLDYKSITTFVGTIALDKCNGIDYRGWKMWLCQRDSSALVFDKSWNGLQVAIDVHYNRTKLNDWDIQLFLRNDDTEDKLKRIAAQYGLTWNNDISRYESKDLLRQEVIKILNELLNSLLKLN